MNSNKSKLTFLTALCGLVTLHSFTPSHAGLISGVSISAFSSQQLDPPDPTPGSPPFDRQALHLIDSSGLDINGPGTHSNVPEGFHWLSDGIGWSATTTDDPDPFVTFDLGGTYNLDGTTIWNYNERGFFSGGNFTIRGTSSLRIETATTFAGPHTSLGTFNLTEAPGDEVTSFGDTLSLSGPGTLGVSFIRFDIISNFNGANFDTGTPGNEWSFVGLSEVQFTGTAIPEPSTGLLCVLGLTGLTFLRKRKS